MSEFPANELKLAVERWLTLRHSKRGERPVAVDLFSGAGGLSLGFDMAGFDVALGLDAWKDALNTYRLNHPSSIPLLKDARELHGSDIKDILHRKGFDDPVLVIGGPPCQGFSYAGKRDPNDERNNLVWHFLRLVHELDVDYFVMENVSGLLTMKTPEGDPVPDKVLERAEENGYHTNIKLLNAVNFWVPQHRRRVIIIGSSLKKPKHLNPLTKIPLTVRDGISDLPTPLPSDPQPYEKEPERPYQEVMRVGSTEIYNHIPTRHSPEMIEKIRNTPPGRSVYPKFKHSWYRLKWNEPAPVMKENHNAPAVHPEEDRVITPREMARLQSFPDAFHFTGTKSSMLKQIGNAVPPILAYFIARHVMKIMNEKTTGGVESKKETGQLSLTHFLNTPRAKNKKL